MIRTYIPKLDELLGGGIPKNALILIAGTTGTMKSTLVYNILYNNSKANNTKSLYLSIENRRESILAQMNGLGLGDPTIVSNIHHIDIGKLHKRSDISKAKEWLEIFKRFLMSLKTNFAFELLAIDSITALKFIIGSSDYQDEVFEFFEWLRDLEVNVFVISKMQEDSRRFTEHDEELLVDGIIHLKLEQRNVRDSERRLQCVKMRGLRNSLVSYLFRFDDGRFAIATEDPEE